MFHVSCHGNKAKALEIHNSNGKSTTPSIKPTAAVIDPSVVIFAKIVVTAAKIF